MNPQERRNKLIPFGDYVILLFDSEFNENDPMEIPHAWIYADDGGIYKFKIRPNLKEIIRTGDLLTNYIEPYSGEQWRFQSFDVREIRRVIAYMIEKEKSELPTWFIGLFILNNLKD